MTGFFGGPEVRLPDPNNNRGQVSTSVTNIILIIVIIGCLIWVVLSLIRGC